VLKHGNVKFKGKIRKSLYLIIDALRKGAKFLFFFASLAALRENLKNQIEHCGFNELLARMT
jgi:hypothetical protein